MKDTTAKKKISLKVEKVLVGKSEQIKTYFKELIFRDYLGFKVDYPEETDTANLDYSLEIHLEDTLAEDLAELEEAEARGERISLYD